MKTDEIKSNVIERFHFNDIKILGTNYASWDNLMSVVNEVQGLSITYNGEEISFKVRIEDGDCLIYDDLDEKYLSISVCSCDGEHSKEAVYEALYLFAKAYTNGQLDLKCHSYIR